MADHVQILVNGTIQFECLAESVALIPRTRAVAELPPCEMDVLIRYGRRRGDGAIEIDHPDPFLDWPTQVALAEARGRRDLPTMLSQEQYDALPTKDPNQLYMITPVPIDDPMTLQAEVDAAPRGQVRQDPYTGAVAYRTDKPREDEESWIITLPSGITVGAGYLHIDDLTPPFRWKVLT